MDKLKSYLLYGLVFLFPLFFLSTTQEFYATNKLYLLAVFAILITFIFLIHFASAKKLSLRKNPIDATLTVFVLTVILSVIFSSPNKIEGILNLNFGLLTIVSFSLVYFCLTNLSVEKMAFKHTSLLLFISNVVLAVITIFLFFFPQKNFVGPAGNLLDLSLILGFSCVYPLSQILSRERKNENNLRYFSLLSLGFVVIIFAFFLAIYTISKQSILKPDQYSLFLPPYGLSWQAAVETLKNPLTILFGAGLANFSSLFTKVRDFAYNQSSLWQINSFSYARSGLIHLLAETGIAGLGSFLVLLYFLLKTVIANRKNLYLLLATVYLLFVLILAPPSLVVSFILFLLLIEHSKLLKDEKNILIFNFAKFSFLVYTTVLLSLLLLVLGSYLLYRSYLAEYYFKKSLDAFSQNKAKELYDNQRRAVVYNPFIERFRLQFSQTNMLIANRLAERALSQNPQSPPDSQTPQFSQDTKQTIAQAVQAAISEGKAAVTLNPQRSQNWENLATVYRNVLNVAQGSDSWTISSYQRAIVLDPKNPGLRLNLGGVYYALANYDEAIKQFDAAITLKPNWANAHYNLAWAAFKKGDYGRAVSEMQYSLSLLNIKSDQDDYKKAKKELEDFKKKQAEQISS